MVLGMTPFTLFHVLLSLVGIVTGLVMLFGWLKSRSLSSWTVIFLFSTLATTLTGFLFPINGFTPALGVGIISTLVIAVALLAYYRYHLAARWRAIFVVSSAFALYLNVFVLVVQSFQKVPPLHALAPNGSEPPFVAVQALVLIAFLGAGYMAVNRFHPAAA